MNNLNGVVCVLTRKNGSEFLWVKRRMEHNFMGGYYAFVGGGIENDENLTIAMARELFEELGILVSTSGIVQWTNLDDREKIKKERNFIQFLDSLELEVDHAAFRPITDWRSGDQYNQKAYVRVFELSVDEELLDRPKKFIDEEATFAEWSTFEKGIELLDSGKAVASALVRTLLIHFSKSIRSFEQSQVLEELSTYKLHKGIFSLPMKSQTLPPSTTTNCVIIADDDNKKFLVVDPGGTDQHEQERLLRFIGELTTDGLEFIGVLLTHHHNDHHGALPLLLKTLNCPVYGHPKLSQRTEYKINPISNIVFGGLRTLETPGHSDDHLAFYIERTKTIVAGDMVASKGSILIAPDHGHVGDYLESLERLIKLNAQSAIPSHGSILVQPSKYFGDYISHRKKRHADIYALIHEKGHGTAIDLVPQIYAELLPDLYPLAALSVESHLLWMLEVGDISFKDDVFFVS